MVFERLINIVASCDKVSQKSLAKLARLFYNNFRPSWAEVSVEIVALSEDDIHILAVTDKLTTGAPHFVQNALPSGISEPHFVQNMSPPALWASGRMPGTGEYYHRELRASGRTGCFLYREGYSSRFIHFTRPATSRSSSGSRKCEVNSDMSPFAL